MDLLTRTCFKNLYTKVVFLKISKFYKLSDSFFYYMLINKLIAEKKKIYSLLIFFNGFTQIYVSTYEKRVAWTVTSIILNKLHLKLKAPGPKSAQDYDYANVWMKKTR